MFKGGLFKLLIPVFSKFSNEGFFDKFIYRHLQFLPEGTCGIANMPMMIVHRSKFSIILHPDGIKMAGNRFFPCDLPLVVCLFYSTKGCPQFVKSNIGTIGSIDKRSLKFAVFPNDRCALGFNGCNAFLP